MSKEICLVQAIKHQRYTASPPALAHRFIAVQRPFHGFIDQQHWNPILNRIGDPQARVDQIVTMILQRLLVLRAGEDL